MTVKGLDEIQKVNRNAFWQNKILTCVMFPPTCHIQ